MSKKKTIRKAIVIGACLLAGGGITTLLIAANRKEAAHFCQGIEIKVAGSGERAYITQADILTQLQKAASGTIVGKGIETIPIAQLEKTVEQHPWIRDAELYFDTHDILHVVVSEREPVARVFTTANTSFYMDSAAQRMPLLADVHVRVPVVTGLSAAIVLHGRDSSVAKEAATIAQYINSHAFWNAQLAQIDITPSGTFELLPVVGNHIIRIGHAENIDEKLSNLLLFYKQVLAKTGFDKYAVVDVQYKDQVIGSHERTVSVIDSVQLQRNIQDLMRKAKLQAEADSMAVVEQVAAVKDSAAQQAVIPEKTPIAEKPKTAIAKPASKAITPTHPEKNTKPITRQKPAPKAVMKQKQKRA